MKRRKFSLKKTALFFIVLIILIVLSFLSVFVVETSSVGGNEVVSVEVAKGDNYYTLSSKLKEKDLIKSEFFYKIFLKLNRPGKLVLGEYELNKNMSVKKIVKTLSDEKNLKNTSVKLTFKEGTSVVRFARTIEEKTDISADDFLNKLNDEVFIDESIGKYWF